LPYGFCSSSLNSVDMSFASLLGTVKGLEAAAYPTTFMNKVCDRLR